jgi:hypothetical protein
LDLSRITIETARPSEVYPARRRVVEADIAGWWNSHFVGARVTSWEGMPGILSAGGADEQRSLLLLSSLLFSCSGALAGVAGNLLVFGRGA